MGVAYTDTFVRPCLTCGGAVQTVRAAEQPHDCTAPTSAESLVAKAFWSGYDTASGASAP